MTKLCGDGREGGKGHSDPLEPSMDMGDGASVYLQCSNPLFGQPRDPPFETQMEIAGALYPILELDGKPDVDTKYKRKYAFGGR